MRFDNIIDAVTLLKRVDGSHIVPIRVYYQRFIVPLDKRRYGYHTPSVSGQKGVCPLHDDVKPSLGILNGRDGRERFNCFGCQSFGHVVDLHRKMQSRHYNRNMGNVDAAYDLLSLMGIAKEPFEALVGERDLVDRTEMEERKARRRAETRVIASSWGIDDYRQSIYDNRNDPAVINTLLHKMTFTAGHDE